MIIWIISLITTLTVGVVGYINTNQMYAITNDINSKD
jgi:methyl-accepting chemotaxis protein